MTHRTITDQAECHRIIMDCGMLGKIKPADPRRAGCIGMFPHQDTDTKTTGTYYIADKIQEDYTLTVLEDITFEQAYQAYLEYAKRHVKEPKDGRLHLFHPHQPFNN